VDLESAPLVAVSTCLGSPHQLPEPGFGSGTEPNWPLVLSACPLQVFIASSSLFLNEYLGSPSFVSGFLILL
jgi:hypothetical protein